MGFKTFVFQVPFYLKRHHVKAGLDYMGLVYKVLAGPYKGGMEVYFIYRIHSLCTAGPHVVGRLDIFRNGR
jgi:hypothetical protein